MKCPVCNVNLLIAERQGVEIDHCPQCRGVWLDRGELDKIIDRAYAAPAASYAPRQESYRRDDHDDRHRGGYGHPPRKKRGFLDDIFDFD